MFSIMYCFLFTDCSIGISSTWESTEWSIDTTLSMCLETVLALASVSFA